ILNKHASPYLATGGTGDVLAGMVVGLMAQGVPAFKAAQIAVWVHGDTGIDIGMGLIAEDIIDQIPVSLKKIFA
ncbi:MAG: hypothetical protein CFH43_00327, partial [Proteobacteria bacterium]